MIKTEKLSISTSDKIAFFVSLATMLSAGINITEAIDSLLEDAKKDLKKVLIILKEDILQGKRIYTSFSRFPLIFDNVTVNIIKAAEEAGTLDSSLKQIKENIQKEAEFIDKIKSALMYPLFIFAVFIAMVTMILIVVVPKIATVFLRLKVTLSLPTRILIFLSDMITQHTVPVSIGIIIIISTIFYLFKTQKKLVLQTLFSFPIISHLIIQIDLVRFTRSLSMLYKSGIIINSSLELCQDIVINKKVEKMIVNTQATVLSGRRFSESLRQNKDIIPSIVIRIIEAGEKSGSLDQSLEEVSEYLDYQVSASLKTFTTLLEPIMLVFVGGMVGGMMLAIVAPIYGLIGQIGNR